MADGKVIAAQTAFEQRAVNLSAFPSVPILIVFYHNE
jgi:hypothetical protein